MQYKRLGQSELNVSEVSFGCMGLGKNDTENAILINDAIHHGINLFDTADLYQQGYNEITLGKSLKGKRQRVFIATKVGNKWNSDGKTWEWCAGKNYILQAVEESLKRLNTEYIDLYQLHGGTIEDPIDEIIEGFEILKAQGKIRYFGLSSIRPNVIRAYLSRTSLTSVMMQYSLLDRRPEEEILPLLLKNKIGVLARGVLAQGLLVDKPAFPYLSISEERVVETQRLVKEIACNNCLPEEVALKFVLDNPAINSAVVGIKNPHQLKKLMNISLLTRLHSAQKERLMGETPVHLYEQHR